MPKAVKQFEFELNLQADHFEETASNPMVYSSSMNLLKAISSTREATHFSVSLLTIY